MHTDEDGTNLPISFAHPELLPCIGGTHTLMHVHKHTPQQTEGSHKNSLTFLFRDVQCYLCCSYIAITETILDGVLAQN